MRLLTLRTVEARPALHELRCLRPRRPRRPCHGKTGTTEADRDALRAGEEAADETFARAGESSMLVVRAGEVGGEGYAPPGDDGARSGEASGEALPLTREEDLPTDGVKG